MSNLFPEWFKLISAVIVAAFSAIMCVGLFAFLLDHAWTKWLKHMGIYSEVFDVIWKRRMEKAQWKEHKRRQREQRGE